MGLRYMFGWLGGIGMAFLAYSVFLRETEGGGGGILAAAGYGYYGIAAACLMFVGMLVSSLGTHRHIARLHVPPTRQNQNWSGFGELLETMKNRSFQSLFLASFFRHSRRHAGRAEHLFFDFLWGLKAS